MQPNSFPKYTISTTGPIKFERPNKIMPTLLTGAAAVCLASGWIGLQSIGPNDGDTRALPDEIARPITELVIDEAVRPPAALPEDTAPQTKLSQRDLHCLATAIYHEARGEPIGGQVAVGQVILNRAGSVHFADTVCGVVHQGAKRPTQVGGCQFSFLCDGKRKEQPSQEKLEPFLNLAVEIAAGRRFVEKAQNALFYHATHLPFRWKNYKPVGVIGNHIFYTLK